jgi:hypothetical protein
MTLKDLEQYVLTYNRAVYRLVASGRSAPNEARLDAFEVSIDFRFPAEFREFTLSPMGGLCLEVFDDLWQRPSPTQPSGDWRSLYSVKVFGIGIGVPRWLDLRAELADLPEEESDLIPFMARGDEPERYCFDLDQQIVRWSPEDGRRESIQHSFYALLMQEIEALDERRQLWFKSSRPKKRQKRKKAE